jgi:tRNA nucleotidyltransferase/poly(A) polymerase
LIIIEKESEVNKSEEIIKTLNKEGFEAYYVGGCVRDWLSNKIPKDIDIVTRAKPDEICQIFKLKKAGVGKSFKVCIVNGFDVATFRKDTYFGESDKNVEIEYADTLEEDLERRDLTINAMAMDINNKLYDPFNGLKHLNAKMITFVGNANKRIWEDPCRIIRAIRFHSDFKGFFSNETREALYNNKLISNVAPERIRDELIKVMTQKQPSEFFITLHSLNLLALLFVELYNLIGIDGGSYHVDDIFTHSMMSGDSMSRKRPLLRLAGYLHDIGKPEHLTVDDKGNRFFNHQTTDLVKYFMNYYKFTKKETRYVDTLCNLHMRTCNGTDKSLRKLLLVLKESKLDFRTWFRIRLADIAGNRKFHSVTISEVKEILKRVKKLNVESDGDFSSTSLAVNGNDVIKVLNMKQGEEVGIVLKYLHEKVLEDPKLNEKEILEDIMERDIKQIFNCA